MSTLARWLILAAVPALAVGAATAQTAPQASPAPAPQRVFLPGAAETTLPLATPWKAQNVAWTIQTAAGALDAAQAQSDANGAMNVPIKTPDVRAPVRMAVLAAPAGAKDGQALAIEAVVLPANPFADARLALSALGIGVLGKGPAAQRLTEAQVVFEDLSGEVKRKAFAGKVILVDGPVDGAARRWLASRPGDVAIIALPTAPDTQELVNATFATPASEIQSPVRFSEAASPVFTDLTAAWLELDRCRAIKLTEPAGLTCVRILAGCVGPGRSVAPTLVELRDLDGRWWLAWPRDIHWPPADIRWAYLVRNSLLWAAAKTMPAKAAK